MRRVALAIVSGLMIVALVAPGVVAAKPATSFVGKASAAAQGGSLQLLAKAKHATRGATFSASAVVHFASGDVAVDLTRHGKSFVAGGKVAVPADQPVGPVAVDITITYDTVAQPAITFNARIQPDDSST